MLKSIITYALARLREPSTIASLAVVAAMFGINLPPEATGLLTDAATSIGNIVDSGYKLVATGLALYAMFTPDRSAGLQKTVDSLKSQLKNDTPKD